MHDLQTLAIVVHGKEHISFTQFTQCCIPAAIVRHVASGHAVPVSCRRAPCFAFFIVQAVRRPERAAVLQCCQLLPGQFAQPFHACATHAPLRCTLIRIRTQCVCVTKHAFQHVNYDDNRRHAHVRVFRRHEPFRRCCAVHRRHSI